MKRVEKDGKFYRLRRGQLVEIPSEWVGRVTHGQTIAKRPSKQIHKLRKYAKHASRLAESGKKEANAEAASVSGDLEPEERRSR
jgi:hypothetical protein